jgi:hypothetical protein
MHIHSTAQVADIAAGGSAEPPGAGMPVDSMAALEAEVLADKGTRLPGFVSAGVIQQGQDETQKQQQAAGELWHISGPDQLYCRQEQALPLALCLICFQSGLPCGCPYCQLLGCCPVVLAVNPEEIELGDDDEDDNDNDGEVAAGAEAAADDAEVQEKAVPAAVFGSLAPAAAQQQPEQQNGTQEPEQLGVLERFKRKRVE